jgi:pyruvate ferredoxin oxidoreductase gamma subunit
MSLLRVRFHGRGGQGMKTASRILGSAAFASGYHVQDSPLYGAERRGAPMMAFTRLSSEPILERGAIERPHLVAVADDTLLDDPAAQPLAGCTAHTVVLVNQSGAPSPLEGPGIALAYDFTAMVLEATGDLASLSTALAASAAKLLGLDDDAVIAAARQELPPAAVQRNVELARRVCDVARKWPRVEPAEEEEGVSPAEVILPELEPPRRAAPSIYARGNTPARHTGSWRQFRPVLELDRCNRCWLCFVWCPDGAIGLEADDTPVVDYDVCKGCLVCAHECPTHAFRIEREVRA